MLKSAPCNCCGCPYPCTNVVTVHGCASANIQGASVTIVPPAGGVATPSSGTTDVNGQFHFHATGTGSWGATVSATNYTTRTNVGLFGNPNSISGTITLSPATNYSCIQDCCQESGPPYYQQYANIPSTLYLNDTFGTITLSNVGGLPCNTLMGSSGWCGSAVRNLVTGTNCDTSGTTATIYFLLLCTTGSPHNYWQVTVSAYDCKPGTTCSHGLALGLGSGGCVSIGTLFSFKGSSASPIQCSPVSASLVGAALAPFSQVYGTGTLTWTLSQ